MLKTIAIPMCPTDFSQKPSTIPVLGQKLGSSDISSSIQFRMNNLEEVTEENFCELATKDARMGNIVIGVYRCFIGASDVDIDASMI